MNILSLATKINSFGKDQMIHKLVNNDQQIKEHALMTLSPTSFMFNLN